MAHRGGHHGGSWKVAYADFVTAMMALFLVLWLTSQDTKIKEAIERSFRNPWGSLTKDSVGIIPNNETQAVRSEKGQFQEASAIELNMLRRLNQELMTTLQPAETEQNDSVKMELSSEGLRISVFDRNRKPIFDVDSIKLTAYGDWVFSTLAWEIARYRNCLIELEGHTEKGRPPLRPDYGKWELTADRANAARRVMLEHGVEEYQIRRVAGFGDIKPLPNLSPQDESNRRVSVVLKVKTADLN
jgi:chemotaxis protein MotB